VIYKIILAPSVERGAKRPKGGTMSMNKYELALVLNAKIEDDARAAELEKVKEIITRFGGTITAVDEWGKKRLAYEIQKMREGFYYFIQFDADATTPAEIESRVRIMDNVLRYLCVKQEA
jgi:small subunit ribosomal protein S6